MRGQFSFKALGIVGFVGLLSGCPEQREQGPALGEPVGIHLEASRSLPALEIAMALTEGVEPEPFVPALSGALHGAFAACPGAVQLLGADGVLQIAFSIEDRHARDVSVRADIAEPEKRCLTDALGRAEISSAPTAVFAQMRWARPGGDETP